MVDTKDKNQNERAAGSTGRSLGQDRFRSVAVAFTEEKPNDTVTTSVDTINPQSEQIPTAKPGRREREKIQRRKEIVGVASALFADNGFNKTTLDEVARLTEFAKPTLYQYFNNKEHLFYSILEEGYNDLDSIVIKAISAQGSHAQQLRTICVMFLIYFRKQMDFFLIHRQFVDRLRQNMDNPFHLKVSQKYQGITGGIIKILVEGHKVREFRKIKETAVCTILLDTISTYTMAFKDGSEFRSATEIAEEIMRLFLVGISAAGTEYTAE